MDAQDQAALSDVPGGHALDFEHRTNRDDRRLVLTVSECAELLGISRALAYELVARGELPAIRLGRRISISRQTIAAIVAGDASTPDPRQGPSSSRAPIALRLPTSVRPS